MTTTHNNTKVYEIVSGDEVMGKVWWDDVKSKIVSDSDKILKFVKEHSYQDITWHDGPKFLDNLNRMFKNGYIFVRTASNNHE